MKVYVVAVGLLVTGAIVLGSISLFVPALTDDDAADSSPGTEIPGVSISTARTNEEGIAFFDDEVGETFEVRVHTTTGASWNGATVHYLEGDGYALFIAEDARGRFLPSWAFFTHTNSIEIVTRASGLLGVERDTDQFNAMAQWIGDVETLVDARSCMTWGQLAAESDSTVVLSSAQFPPPSLLWEGVGAASTTNRLVADRVSGLTDDTLFDVFKFDLKGIATGIRHYEALTISECRPDPSVQPTAAPSTTPVPSQPADTPLAEAPADTPQPAELIGTPNPGQPTDTPDPDAPTDTAAPLPTDTPPPPPTNTPRPQPTVAPVDADFLRITDIQPPLGMTVGEDTLVSVTVEYRVSSVLGVSIAGLADMERLLVGLGIHSPANTQGTLTLSGVQYSDLEVRLCAVSVTMERIAGGGGQQLASDSRAAC